MFHFLLSIIFFKVLLVVGAIITFWLIINTDVFADHVVTSDPDTLQILNVRGYQSLKEDNDIMVIGKYNVDYLSLPIHAIVDTFLFRFIDPSTGLELQSVEASPFNDLGYGEGIFAFYFSAADVITLGVTFSGTYTVKIQGNPSAFPTPPTIETSTITWRPTVANVFHLKNDVLDVAQELELAWAVNSVTLLATSSEGLVFTTDGEFYFEQTIPNLRDILPSLFTGSVSLPNFDEIDATFSQGLVTAIDSQDSWQGDWVVYTDEVATQLNIPAEIVRTSAWFLFSGVIALAFFVATQNTTFVLIILALLFTLGALLNLVNPVLVAISTFGLVVMVGWQFFYNRASA